MQKRKLVLRVFGAFRSQVQQTEEGDIMQKKRLSVRIITFIIAMIILIASITQMARVSVVQTRADGILGGISWGNSTKGVITLPDYTVLRLGFDVRDYGSYRDEGYLYRYPSMYQGYSIIVGTCDGVSRCILSPTSDGSGKIDYHSADNMYRSYSDCDDGLTKAIYKLTMGGTTKYTGAGVSALSSSPPIYMTQYLDSTLMTELSAYTGGDSDKWNTAAFREVADTEWGKTKDTSESMKQNAMAMTILAMYLKHKGAAIDPQQVYSYYTKQEADKDYILVLENLHAAQASGHNQLFFTHQNYVFDAVTKYNVHNSMRAGTVLDWVRSCGTGAFTSVTADSIAVREIGNPLGVSQTDAQLFNQWFKKGLAGNRIALSSYFYRDQMLNYDMDEATRNMVGSPKNLWFTAQYKKSSSSRAENFAEYKTGFAVFKAPPITADVKPKGETSKAVGSHTLSAAPENQKVKRFSQLSVDGKEVVTSITLTPTADGLDSLANTVYNLLTYDNCVINTADGSITIPEDAVKTSYENQMFTYGSSCPADHRLEDRAVTFNSADWSLDAEGEGMDEPGNSTGTKTGMCTVSGYSGNGKSHKQKLNGICVKYSDVYSADEQTMKNKIKDDLRSQLVNYSLGEIKSYDGHFEQAGSFTWKFKSAVKVNCSVADFMTARVYTVYDGTEYGSGRIFREDDIEVDGVKYYSELTNSEQSREVYYYYDEDHCFVPFCTGWQFRKLNDSSNTSFTVNFGTSSATATIIVENIVSKKLRWQNQPIAFAEVKEGTYSDNRQTESYEVMQGVPTSRTLYANIGGTPFYVDIICELKTVDFNKDFSYNHTIAIKPLTEAEFAIIMLRQHIHKHRRQRQGIL